MNMPRTRAEHDAADSLHAAVIILGGFLLIQTLLLSSGVFAHDRLRDWPAYMHTSPTVAQSGGPAIRPWKFTGDEFTAIPAFSAAAQPTAAVAGDFDKDGRMDVVLAGEHGVLVYLRSDPGGFASPERYELEGHGVALVVADANSDGREDLAIVDVVDNSMVILLGKGNGRFDRGTTIPARDRPVSIVAGFFNDDREVDLAVAHFAGDDIAVFLGNGDGTFREGETFGVGPKPVWLASGDFNGDGKADIAPANSSNGTITALLGDGRGGFRKSADSPVGQQPMMIAVGDFNGDRYQDLAVVNLGDDTVAIILGRGG
jgi:hypothetical protein